MSRERGDQCHRRGWAQSTCQRETSRGRSAEKTSREKSEKRLNVSIHVRIFEYSFGFFKLMKCLKTNASFVSRFELLSLKFCMQVGGVIIFSVVASSEDLSAAPGEGSRVG